MDSKTAAVKLADKAEALLDLLDKLEADEAPGPAAGEYDLAKWEARDAIHAVRSSATS